MRIECDYCLAVYESEDSENEERTTCPFCASRSNRATLRQFKVAPDRPRVRTSPFGLEGSAPAASSRTSVICPPASRPAEAPPHAGIPTPAYVKAAERVAATAPRPDPEQRAPVELPGIDPPASASSDRHRPAYDWQLPLFTDASPSPNQEPRVDTPQVSDIPRATELPRISDSRQPRDTDRPFVRSERSPAEGDFFRRRVAKWAPFVLGAAGAVLMVRGWPSGSPETIEHPPSSAPVSVASFVSAVDQGISVGDIDQAVSALDRASRVAPRDPSVLLARAKLVVERADVAWLIRKATPHAPSDGANYEDFVRTAGEARAAAEEALRAMPDSDDARRVLVNALRIFGEIDRGREVAAKLRDRTGPESAYAFATLDMMAPGVAPGGPAAQLRENAWVGGFPGKARAALVYALVRSGDVDGASAELDKLSLLARPHPAMPALQAFVDGARAVAKPPPAPPPRPDKHKTTKLCPEDSKVKHADPPSMLREAVNARCRGDIDGARKIYQAILDAKPNDAEALSGMGDLERQQDAWDTARNFYAEALRANPSFMPAAIGAADVEWDVGNLPVAQRKYREIIENFPSNAYPPRVQERAAPPPRGSKGS